MTNRELWQAIMNYQDCSCMPMLHWKGWRETYDRWYSEGMPMNCDEYEYFNVSPYMKLLKVNIGLFPVFEEEIIEETSEYRIYKDGAGVVQKDWKKKECIPHYMSYTFQKAEDWDEYKRRLKPGSFRIPNDIDDQISEAESSGTVVSVFCGSLMGWIRNWMGVENMCYLMYDSRDVYIDIVNTLADMSCWGIDQLIPRMKKPPDMGHCWEDICGKTGPLVSPDIFKECVAPGYIKIRNKLEEYGVKFLSIDSDGDISMLVEPWLDSGVNIQFPLEIGTWDPDPMELRKRYGRELRLMGGFNKLELEKGQAAIDSEIERRIPLMKDGGYIMMPDHHITPDVSLRNYKYYLERVRELRL